MGRHTVTFNPKAHQRHSQSMAGQLESQSRVSRRQFQRQRQNHNSRTPDRGTSRRQQWQNRSPISKISVQQNLRQLPASSLTRRLPTSRSRLAHSRQFDLERSRSRLSKSVVTTPKRLQNRQAKEIKQSIQPKIRGDHSHSNNLVCVNCFNAKQVQLHRHRKYLEQLNADLQSRQPQQPYFMRKEAQRSELYKNFCEKHALEVDQFNQAIIRRHNEESLKSLKEKQKEHERIAQEQKAYETEKAEREKYLLNQQFLLKSRLQEQINLKKSKRQIQEIRTKPSKGSPQSQLKCIIPSRELSQPLLKQMQLDYKADLLRQINEAKFKKQVEEKQRLDRRLNFETKRVQTEGPKHENWPFQLALVTSAQQRNQNALKQVAEFRKQSHEQQAFLLQQREQAKLKKEAIRQEQLRRRMSEIEEQQKLRKNNQSLRRNKIDQYLHDLKGQIQLNKQKRQREIEWLGHNNGKTKPSANGSPVQGLQPSFVTRMNDNIEGEKDECGSCEKVFPKRMLSEFVVYNDEKSLVTTSRINGSRTNSQIRQPENKPTKRSRQNNFY